MSKTLRPFQEFKINSEEQEIPKVSYETDLITVYPEMFADSGATRSTTDGTVTLNAQNEELVFHFFIDDKIDPSRDMIFTTTQRIDGGANYNISRYLKRISCDGSTASWTVEWNYIGDTLNSGIINRFQHNHFTIDKNDVVADNQYVARIRLDDAGRSIIFSEIAVRYYQKRVIP